MAIASKANEIGAVVAITSSTGSKHYTVIKNRVFAGITGNVEMQPYDFDIIVNTSVRTTINSDINFRLNPVSEKLWVLN